MGVARRWLALTCVVGAMVAGCTVNPEEGDSASTTSASPSAMTSEPTSPSPTTPAFGSDVTIPADGVGAVRVSDADDWTLVNRGDNAYAQVLSPAAAPALAVEAQATIGVWLGDYRAAASAGETTPATTPAATSPTSPASATAESGTESADPDAPATPAATENPTAEPEDTGSFRALGQVVAARSDVAGIRLYGRTSTGQTPTERWRTIWFDPAQNRVVDGTALFATARSGEDPLSRARQLAIAAAPEGDLGGVSDRDLFHSAAFTPKGDLVLYVGRAGAAPTKVVLAAADVDGLLSALGRQAKVAAADSVPPSPTSSAPSETATETDAPTASSPTATATEESPTSPATP